MKKQQSLLFAIFAAAAVLLATQVHAQTDADLRKDGGNANVLTYGMGQNQQRFSSLAQISRRNVKRLVPAWALSLENDYGQQGQPMAQDGILYVSDAKWTVAVDGVTGRQLWRTAVDFDPDARRVVCCGVYNRGLALYNGMVLRGTIDSYMVALDQKTGKEIWKTKIADWKNGYTITSAPIVANGVLVTGVAGGDMGARGLLAGLDPATGKELWRFHTTAAPGEKGGDTWGVKDAYLTGGGGTWVTGSYDPELDLVYWAAGQPGPWNPNYRGGDSLFTNSILAFRPKTGELVWHYQFTPDDPFDYDAVSEFILADMTVDRQKRKVVIQVNRNGFLYVLDRADGKLLAANAYTTVTWASGVDLATGRPIETEVTRDFRAGKEVKFRPAIPGGKGWYHAAYDAKKNVVYANMVNMSSVSKLKTLPPYKPGMHYDGAGPAKHEVEPGEPTGYIKALDPMTGKSKWEVRLDDAPNWSSIIATAGGLLFTGRATGDFVALDADTGKQLWHFQTGTGINSSPITWSYKGKQYVTVLAGTGGRRFTAKVAVNVPNGSSVWTFAVPN